MFLLNKHILFHYKNNINGAFIAIVGAVYLMQKKIQGTDRTFWGPLRKIELNKKKNGYF